MSLWPMFSQALAMLPAFAHARRNSQLVALVSDDETKRRAVSKKYRVPAYSYEEYDACLEQVDAVYIALPNSLHAEYSIRAARAGVHVLCEKPMAVTADECEQMIEARETSGVKLMIAYRLHFEEINLNAIDLVRQRWELDLRDRLHEARLFRRRSAMPDAVERHRDLGHACLRARREEAEVLRKLLHARA